ncbi:hypothetical protein NZ698_07660 [Chryseobacterium sp. PBS4-4]|uniref:VCBS repeat-containing protein n=1 Tax=Chryseobacterium edaphi TaxID=2976532 RepID=A0ABT2W535_9FLAO|nr:hypothetical protein [Chryseobacterium edaphi]MCU7617069.1 hypothetical protein [Chryseobacterium edaphi]
MLSCKKKNEFKENSNNTKIVNQTNEHITERDSVNGNEYVYYFKTEKNNSSNVEYKRLDSLIILKKGKKYVLNLIDKNISTGVIEGGVYSNLDYNFDGVNDIMLYPHITSHSVYNKNYIADFFIFNKENQKYENIAELDTIANLDVCKEGRYLVSNDGVFLRKYIWKGKNLELVKTIKESQAENENNDIQCK